MPKHSEQANPDRFLRPKQVQDLLGIGATALWNYVHQDVLRPAHRTPGGHARYRESDVASLLAELKAVA
jgi:predicted DNA-binding transcriptional regulator AlpA